MASSCKSLQRQHLFHAFVRWDCSYLAVLHRTGLSWGKQDLLRCSNNQLGCDADHAMLMLECVCACCFLHFMAGRTSSTMGTANHTTAVCNACQCAPPKPCCGMYRCALCIAYSNVHYNNSPTSHTQQQDKQHCRQYIRPCVSLHAVPYIELEVSHCCCCNPIRCMTLTYFKVYCLCQNF